MVVVMPAFPETQQAYQPLVTAHIRRLKFALAKAVTDRVNAPCDMMQQENAHQPSPEQERASEKDHHRIIDQVAAVDVWVGITLMEHPAKMGMEKDIKRAMRIT